MVGNCTSGRMRALVLSSLLSTPIGVRCGNSIGDRAHAGCEDAAVCLDSSVRCHAGKRVSLKPNTQNLDRLLESALIQSWPDLMKDATSGSLHLEYAFAPDNSLDYLTLWSSTLRGQWDLVCDYWMSSFASHHKGIHFKNGFRSDDLSHTLEFIMQHQRTFSPLPNLGRSGVLQIQVPSGEESRAAAKSLSEAFSQISSFSIEPSTA